MGKVFHSYNDYLVGLTENLGKAKAAVDQIVSRLETKFRGFNISEIWKAGSLGHGTVVPGHYDIDLVLYSRDISVGAVCSYDGYSWWTTQLKEFIDKEFGIESKTPGKYHRSVQFVLVNQGVRLEVDLLVSPFWSNPRDFYQVLVPMRAGHDMFTVCASKWQIQFFSNVDNQAKEYIRRAKAWRNIKFDADKPGRPSSYLMSLLVVKAHEIANMRYDGAGPSEVTKELITLVKNPLLDSHWQQFYTLAEYRDLVPIPPRVIDPANPANNVWKSGIRGGDASVFVRMIDTIDLSEVYFKLAENLSKAKAAVDLIVSGLETKFGGFNISEIWKAGSLGHGTVVPGHYDIDLVLYSRDISGRVVCSDNGFDRWTFPLKKFIKEEFEIESKTPGNYNRSVQFECSCQGVNLEVDLLVSPFWSNPGDFYQFLVPMRAGRDMFTACASKWQIQFFRNVDNQAKEYIRRAKAWRNTRFGADKPGRPSSYLMSLLVVRAYEIANMRYDGAGPREVTKELITLVKNSSLDVHWEKFYRMAEHGHPMPVPPRVIDPANPFNNVWQSGIIGGDASVLVSRIDTIDLSQVNN